MTVSGTVCAMARRSLSCLLLVVAPMAVARAQSAPPAAADWRAAAHQRIEEHRKANLEMTVHDAQGRPVTDATVTVAMKRHRFGFGALIGLNRWGDLPNAADARRHLSLVEERFNKVVTILRPERR